MKWYFDLSLMGGCMGIMGNPGDQIIYTGTQIHTEPEKYRGCDAALRLERESDLHFWFGKGPEPGIYTVPRMEIGGFDSRGGLFAGCPDFALGSGAPMYYIDRERRCFRIACDDGGLSGMSWREMLVPAEEVEIFGSLEQAREKYRIFRPKDDEELFAVFRHMDEVWEGNA